MTHSSRRQFVQGGLVAATLGPSVLWTACGGSDAPPNPSSGAPDPTFVQPPVLRSTDGVLQTTFDVQYIDTSVTTGFGDRMARLRTWNGFVGGPTLRVKPGDRLVIQVNNNLPPNTDPVPPDENTPHHFNTINLHTHGLHVSPMQDDVLTMIAPGAAKTYTYDIPADHPCGTFWYHAHKHGSTAMHLLSGMAGLLIVEGEVDDDPGVVEAAQLDFVIQELNLAGVSGMNNASETFEVPDYVTPRPFARADSFFLVNGAYIPELTVNPGRTIRLRVLNGSTRNTIPFSIPGAKVWVIALDGITLPEPVEQTTVRLAPANRVDLIVRFDTAGSFDVVKGAFMNGGGMPFPEQKLASVRVAGDTFDLPGPSGPLTTPAQLPTIGEDEVTERRTLTYAVGMNGPVIGGQPAGDFTMDGARFDENVVNQTIPLNAVIEWTLRNTSGAWHSHHIHINPFQVFETSESDNKVNEIDLTRPVWLDTVDIPPMGFIKFRSRYPDFTGKFVQHCHILTHEDIGMMQIVEVVS